MTTMSQKRSVLNFLIFTSIIISNFQQITDSTLANRFVIQQEKRLLERAEKVFCMVCELDAEECCEKVEMLAAIWRSVDLREQMFLENGFIGGPPRPSYYIRCWEQYCKQPGKPVYIIPRYNPDDEEYSEYDRTKRTDSDSPFYSGW